MKVTHLPLNPGGVTHKGRKPPVATAMSAIIATVRKALIVGQFQTSASVSNKWKHRDGVGPSGNASQEANFPMAGKRLFD